MPEIPQMVMPSSASTLVFAAIIVFIAIAFVAGVNRARDKDEHKNVTSRWTIYAAIGMAVWLGLNWIIPASRILEAQSLPPRPIFLFVFCFILAFVVAFSRLGSRFANLPFAALILFHAFRLPLELVLHNWYDAGTMPIQMTYEGHNFDIVTGVLALVVGSWAMARTIPKVAIWIFNLIGFALLMAVIVIATTSSPVPFRQYLNDPPVLLVFHAPYSWIVSVAVTGALTAHLILFRKLTRAPNRFAAPPNRRLTKVT